VDAAWPNSIAKISVDLTFGIPDHFAKGQPLPALAREQTTLTVSLRKNPQTATRTDVLQDRIPLFFQNHHLSLPLCPSGGGKKLRQRSLDWMIQERILIGSCHK
jgi:hypothetical protein